MIRRISTAIHYDQRITIILTSSPDYMDQHNADHSIFHQGPASTPED